MGHENLIGRWTECSRDFERVLLVAEKIAAKEKFCSPVDMYLYAAGELFFNTISRIDVPSFIHEGFKSAPVGKGVSNKDEYCYREYWLCVLALFCRKDSRFLKYLELRNLYLPSRVSTRKKSYIDWSYVQDEFELAQPYMIRKPAHLKMICEASIDLCGLITKMYKDYAFSVNEKMQIISYKGKSFQLGIGVPWDLFKMLYKANGKPVANKKIEAKFQQKPNIIIGELKRYFRNKKAEELIAVIKNKHSVGYWLDIASL